MPRLILALEAGHDDNMARVEELEHLLGRDVGNLSLGVKLVRDNACLGTG